MNVSYKLLSVFLTAGIVTVAILAAATMEQPVSSVLEAREALAAVDDLEKPLPALKETKTEIDKRYRYLAETTNLKPRRRPSQKDLLVMVAKQPGGQEKIDRANGKTPGEMLPSSDEIREELQKLETDQARMLKTMQRKRPTKKQLLDAVVKQPGGKERIQRANRSKIQSGLILERQNTNSLWLAAINPFWPKAAWAQTLRRVKLQPAPFSVELTPENPSSETPYAHYTIIGATRGRINRSSHVDQMRNFGPSLYGTVVEKAQVSLFVEIPKTDWYLVNFECSSGGFKAELLHKVISSTGLTHYPKVGAWSSATVGERENCASLLYLEAGVHHLILVQLLGNSVNFYGLTVDAYEPMEFEQR